MNNKSTNKSTTTSSDGTSNIKNIKNNKFAMNLIKFGVVVGIVAIAALIYYIFFNKKSEGFENDTPSPTPSPSPTPTPTLTQSPISSNTNDNTSMEYTTTNNETIYEMALKDVYSESKRLICSMIPGMNKASICNIDNQPFVIYNFPIHMIKLLDDSVLAVFNDGRLYKKENINNSMWLGPLNNSMPNNAIPLRMVTLANDLTTLLGVGYDNKLYIKQNKNNNLDLTGEWRVVPNNTNIIYVFYDNDTNYLVSITTEGKLIIKNSADIATASVELNTRINKPILRAYYDMNGYMLVIDTKFNLYQLNDINWKNSIINTQRGANSSKLQDIMYNTDGTLYGLVFNFENNMVQLMKQKQSWYLGDFLELSVLNEGVVGLGDEKFVLTNQDIIKSKSGSIKKYLDTLTTDDVDDDANMAYQKQLFETRAKIKEFCNNRYSTTSSNYENWDLYANVENNETKIKNMKSIINNFLKYEPDKNKILTNYPGLQNFQ